MRSRSLIVCSALVACSVANLSVAAQPRLGKGKKEGSECAAPGVMPVVLVAGHFAGTTPWTRVWETLGGNGKQRRAVDADLEFDDQMRVVRQPSGRVPAGIRGVLFVTTQDWPIDLSSQVGERTIGKAVELARQWACGAPRAFVAAIGTAGLYVRAYAQSPRYRGDIAGLVTVATPHRGSLLAINPAGPPEALRSCWQQVGLPRSIDHNYLAMTDPAYDRIRNLNLAEAGMRAIPRGLYVREVVADGSADSRRTGDCLKKYRQLAAAVSAGQSVSRIAPPSDLDEVDDGVTSGTAQTIPPTAFADFRRPADPLVERMSFPSEKLGRRVAETIVEAIKRTERSDADQYVLPADTVLATHLLSDVAQTIRVRGCRDNCTDKDTTALHGDNKHQGAILLRGVRAIRTASMRVLLTKTDSLAGRRESRSQAAELLVISQGEESPHTSFWSIEEGGSVVRIALRPDLASQRQLPPVDSLCIATTGTLQDDSLVAGSLMLQFVSTARTCAALSLGGTRGSPVQSVPSDELRSRAPVARAANATPVEFTNWVLTLSDSSMVTSKRDRSIVVAATQEGHQVLIFQADTDATRTISGSTECRVTFSSNSSTMPTVKFIARMSGQRPETIVQQLEFAPREGKGTPIVVDVRSALSGSRTPELIGLRFEWDVARGDRMSLDDFRCTQ